MPAGFQVVGSHGVVQIDQNFINMGLVSKGRITIPAAQSTMGQATLTVTANSPILCIRPVNSYATILSVARSGSQHTYTLAGGLTGAGGAAIAETFDWFLFDKMQPPTAGTFGLEVRDASGVTTFNSNWTPMILSAIGQIPNASMPGNPATVDTAVARTYAVCLSEGRLQAAAFGSNMSVVYLETVKVTATGAVTSYGPVQQIPAEVAYDSTEGGQILLVDVTGL